MADHEDTEPDPDDGGGNSQPLTVQVVLQGVWSHIRLDRERSVLELKKYFNFVDSVKCQITDDLQDLHSSADEQVKDQWLKELEEQLLQILEKTEGPMPTMTDSFGRDIEVQLHEMKHGSLLACCTLLETLPDRRSEDFMQKLQSISMKLLAEDDDTLVRHDAGCVLACLSKRLGDVVYLSSRDFLFDLITKNLSLTNSVSPEDEVKSVEQGFDINISSHAIQYNLVLENNGWYKVEPSLKSLEATIDNLDKAFVSCIEPRLFDLVQACLQHQNRYVRETGFDICGKLIKIAPLEMKEYSHPISQHLRRGLTDNWSHVRHGASVATRIFFLAYSDIKEDFFPILLPKLTLGRYYRLGGTRMYAQESWRLIVGTEGVSYVSKYIDEVVNSYLASASSENIAEREAACSSILELAAKMERSKVSLHVIPLLKALITCCGDPTWSVRDSASLAIGSFIQHFPEESKPFMSELYPILFKNLEDPTQLLRQGAATALASIAKAYGTEALSLILDKVVTGLAAIEKMNDPDSSHKSTGNVPMYCNRDNPHCESTAPSLVEVTSASLFQALNPGPSQISRPISPLPSCASCRRGRVPQPWHLVDGCLFLIGTLSDQEVAHSELPPLIPLMVKAVQVRTYEEHYKLHVTLCLVIPFLAKAIGKRPFKEYLELLFEPIFYTIQSSHPQTSGVGKDCLKFLGKLLGPNILKARVELYDARLVPVVEDIATQPQ